MKRTLQLTDAQREVVDRPEHARGLDESLARVLTVRVVSSQVSRIELELDGTPHQVEWARPNTVVRLEIPSLVDDAALVSRVYTVRRFTAPGTVEIDLVRHGHRTPVTTWLAGLIPGDAVRVIGPRAHLLPVTDGRAIEIVADDSALPAVASILAAWPDGTLGRVRTTSTDETVLAELPLPAGVVLERITSLDEMEAPVDACLWAAGERDEMRSLRARCVAAGMPRDEMRIYSYWKRGVSNSVIDARRLDHFSTLLRSGMSTEGVDDLDIDV
jgi:NADPH-dependent ferric siderophore reductase